MRSPDSRPGYARPGRVFEDELNLRYLSPGAFTVLSPEENGSPPDPPPAPPPHRLSPNPRRSKNQSFAIIAESTNYDRSRSPSPPSGRVSPFRGRGFNPTGSRHASPAASPPPPPEDNRLNYRQNNNNNNSNNHHHLNNNNNKNIINRKRSNIPQLKRRNSSVLLSTEDDEEDDSSPKHQRRNSLLKPQLSRSLNNVASKPPQAPAPGSRRYAGMYSRNPSFSRLSPIVGSSPEPSTDAKSQSSPSRIPKSRSSPSSRKHSPASRDRSPPEDHRHRLGGSTHNLNGAGGHQRVGNGVSRSRSRVGVASSREPSPSAAGRPPISPTKIPGKSYRNVQAKVNSFNAKSKTKVPNNHTSSSHHVTSNLHSSRSSSKLHQGDKTTKSSSNSKLNRTDSISNVSKAAKSKPPAKANGTSSNNSKTSSANGSVKGESPEKKNLRKTPSQRTLNKEPAKGTESDSSSTATTMGTPTAVAAAPIPAPKKEEARPAPPPRISEMLASAPTVVSTTTETVTKPLKIEAPITDTPAKSDNILSKPIKETPMYMDTEDSQTLLKDHSMTKLSPNATAIISLAGGEQTGGGALPNVETTTTVMTAAAMTTTPAGALGTNGQNVHSNSLVVNSNGGLDGQVTNNINKLISPDDSFGARVHYEHSANATTVLPQDVRPIKIMVQERADNMEVQSGNVRFPPSATNGTAQGAGAPPYENEDQIAEEIPTSRCGKFMHQVKQTMSCGRCKRKSDANLDMDGGDKPPGCFACMKKKKKLHDVEEIIISSAEEVEGAKKSFFDKLTCCRSNKVGDSTTTGCCGLGGKNKEKWQERRDSILSAPVPLTTKDRCKNFFKALFCCCGSRCCRRAPPPPKIDDAASRRASLLSKKKSLTPTVIPQEDPKNKLDSSLVDYTSTMKAAIPVLPIALAYICLFFNIFAPGTGTVFSGLFCLCMGKPRFSQRDDPKSRVGSFIINLFIGAGQLFTVLFCLVGWGWSIWWGVIMIKVAKKYKKLKLLEERMEAQQEKEGARGSKEGSQKRDVEKGRS